MFRLSKLILLLLVQSRISAPKA